MAAKEAPRIPHGNLAQKIIMENYEISGLL